MIFQPSDMQPRNVDINSLITNIFSCTISGSICKAYQLTILSNATNTNIYQTSIVDISATPLYGGDILSVSVANTSGMTNSLTSNYKWKIRLYDNYPSNPTFIDSSEVYFQARSPVTIDIPNITSTITLKNISPQGTYSQNEGIAVKYYNFSLYDLNNILIKSSGDIYNSRLIWNGIDGLISGNSYSLTMQLENQDSTISTITKNFIVLYDKPQLTIKPQVEQLDSQDAIKISWPGVYVINAISLNPTDYEFINSNFYTNDKAVKIHTGKSFYYDNINNQPIIFPSSWAGFIYINLPTGFTGNIINIADSITFTNYTLSYDGTKFIANTNETYIYYNDSSVTGDTIWWKITISFTNTEFLKITI